MKQFLCASALAVIAALPACAQELSPVGLWKNIDDITGKPKALIRIVEANGEVQGRIEKLFVAPGEDPHPRCSKCTGANRDKPVIGMVFMSGLRKDGRDYTGGEIIDPDDGKVYRSKLTVVDGGKKLNVRGYIGMPMFGRSQIWVRQE
ncbi:DUF2147 domain-containing protein [Massilia sp. PAMC28688]|uniref:DUF2147 domain-containing protein n=1 Tax=Massilia sp. PAMC28688 TaxID=2861283 RepID=UPI001C63824F|nr:DUF2147 domain-containing protein [Massilia sp. PAMC28688]QYF94490.1 DUF2147 domain-containing protein [Massilia sp. PAMC28688]